MKELYLDSNAHIPMSKNTLQIYNEFQQSCAGWGHPSAPSKPGLLASSALETARCKIASLLSCNSEQLIFTSSCTQACEWGLKILLHRYNKIYCSPIEHTAVRDVLKNPQYLPISNGIVDIIKTELPVVCIYVQNEIGTIQPILELQSPFIFSDMCQAVGKVDICLRDMNVDIATFGAHKFGGPAGVGILYLKDIELWEEFGTGSRYFNDRPGTPDVAGIVATAAALEETLFNMPEHLQLMSEFQDALESTVETKTICRGSQRVKNTTFLHVPGKALDLITELNSLGIYIGLGSACGSFHTGPSVIMKAIGENGDSNDYIRISQKGAYGKQEALYLAEIINKILRK